jgi:hypothetical protein
LKKNIHSGVLLSLFFWSATVGAADFSLTQPVAAVQSTALAANSTPQPALRSAVAPVTSSASAVAVFGSTPREEQESFFDFLRTLKDLPSDLVFPDPDDDDATFAQKSTSLLTQIDTYLNDPKLASQNWVRRTIKNLKVKAGFSNWVQSMNQRLTAVETRVNSIYSTQALNSLEPTRQQSVSATPRAVATTTAATVRR